MSDWKRVECPVCREVGVTRLLASVASARCSACGASSRRSLPFLADMAVGFVLDGLAVVSIAASVILQNVLPFIAWIVLWLAIDQFAPLKPDLKDPITKRQAERGGAV